MNKIETRWEYINEYIDKPLYYKKKIRLFIDAIPYEENGKFYCPYSHSIINKQDDDIFIFIQVESYIIISNVIQKLINNKNIFSLFDYILAFDNSLLQQDKKCIKFLPYIKFFWIAPPSDIKNIYLECYGINKKYNYSMDKNYNVTFMNGHKNYCPGHNIRHEIWNKQNEIFIPKKFFYGCNHENMIIQKDNILLGHSRDKTEMFENSMFAIVIENNKSHNYFTEKFIECIVSKTIPIYWGCPNINEYFDMGGIITFNTTDELIKILNQLTPNDYFRRKQNIENNYNKWINMQSFGDQLMQIVNNIK